MALVLISRRLDLSPTWHPLPLCRRTPHLPFVLSLTRVHRQPAGSANQQRCFHQSALPSRRSLNLDSPSCPLMSHLPQRERRMPLARPTSRHREKRLQLAQRLAPWTSGLSQAYFPYPSARVLIAPRSSHPAPWAPLFRKQRPLGNLTRNLQQWLPASCLMRQAGHSLQLKSRHGGGYFPLARLTPFPTRFVCRRSIGRNVSEPGLSLLTPPARSGVHQTSFPVSGRSRAIFNARPRYHPPSFIRWSLRPSVFTCLSLF